MREISLGLSFTHHFSFQNPATLHRCAKGLTIFWRHRQEWQPIFFFNLSQHRQRGLHWNWIRFDKKVLEEWMILIVKLQCGRGFAIGERLHHLRNLSWNDIGRHADHAMSADSHEWQSQRIVAAQNFKTQS